MAYLPFYITPEELAAYQEAQEQEIGSGKSVFCWKIVNLEMSSPFVHIYMTLVPMMLCIAVFFALADSDRREDTIFLACVLSSCVILFYFFMRWGILKQYHYVFSEKGIVVKSHSTIPKWINSANQVVGWIGALVCLFMVVAVGPIALAGAGGFILVSFRMLERQPNERTEIKVGEREDWLFAYYNKKRKVIQFFFKHDRCEYQDTARTTILRSQDRFDCYVFFKTKADLESVITQLSNIYKLDCKEVHDHKKLFEDEPESRLYSIPVCSREYQTDEVFDLRIANTPLPEREYIHNGEWRTESEIAQLKKDSGNTLSDTV